MESARKEEAREVAALKADIAHVREEIARSAEEQKAKLQAELDALHQKLRSMLTHTTQRSARGGKEVAHKVQAMEKKAAKAPLKAKAAIKARIKVRKKSKKATKR